MLSANDKVIKLWKIEYKREKKYESCKKLLQKGKLAIPRSKVVNESFEGRCRTIYKSAHEHSINSLSLCADGEHFISADDMRINIWNIENTSTVYNILDIKPRNMEDLDEAITHCEFHPKMPSVLVYTTSKGFFHLCDLRESSSFQKGPSLSFEVGKGQKKNAFSELINCLSSAKFSKTEPHVLASRDYLNVRLWDIRSAEKMPYMSC